MNLFRKRRLRPNSDTKDRREAAKVRIDRAEKKIESAQGQLVGALDDLEAARRYFLIELDQTAREAYAAGRQRRETPYGIG